MPSKGEAQARSSKAQAKAKRKKWFILGFAATVIVGLILVAWAVLTR